ncbi:hypothetical protein PUNSTDRAFT_124219 [Punctularia strigosozonata HHB-11173 SS5]|uniref:uncharacterized protein n=1 Tax=Punctularia strigosozonata (strain HHB-11173) TaxID=741275 RepID=UPI0004418622|nr:uncharacterized protein PUNSTDRAFT_124219 [Punctularia strigosozonata HHB-11173 SS5]EIN12290.1 hypothetical protein PUNSTDRAFT_124219 [Punctularia strigosozonata HHB-11173 SS5]
MKGVPLAVALLICLFAPPCLSEPTTLNDQFRAIAVLKQKAPEDPICCLRPLPSVEPEKEDDLLLSFEEWKAKRLLASEERDSPPATGSPKANTDEAGSDGADPSSPPTPSPHDLADPHTPPEQQQEKEQQHQHQQLQMAPHFRIPLTDRFNYANSDCSARVHVAHRGAKSASSILSSKKDRYMLSPCGAKEQFVVVELCDDIRIDTVQLANFEFFSGVFKEFTVSVAKTYVTNPDGWTFAGRYTAKNVRGVQSFHPPPSLRDFYRFIRIDLHSHYGNEYYCPVSLLRVYGLTQLEEYKWDVWEAESRAKRGVVQSEEHPSSAPVATEIPSSDQRGAETPSVGIDAPSDSSTSVIEPRDAKPSTGPSAADHDASNASVSFAAPSSSPPTSDGTTSSIHTVITPASSGSSRSMTNMTPDNQAPSITTSLSRASQQAESQSGHIISTISSSSTNVSDSSNPPTSSVKSSTSSLTSVAALVPTAVTSVTVSYPPIPPPVAGTGGESIYRTIMNRVAALEANTTLYARYVEEQIAGVREIMRRLSEDVGRLEGISKAQGQMYQRTIQELEKERRRIQYEHGELVSRVNYLADEVALEKWLGIAQLLLLLTVLVFMGLTRGSRGESWPVTVRRSHGSVREWGKRTLSFGGASDWMNRLRTRSLTGRDSAPSIPASPSPSDMGNGNGVHFPSPTPLRKAAKARPPPVNTQLQIPPERRVSAGARTPRSIPLSRHYLVHAHRPTTPAKGFEGRPQMQRSNSQGPFAGPSAVGGAVGSVPRSAKRWARSAHLHEVKLQPALARSAADGNGDGDEDGAGVGAKSDGTEDAADLPATAPSAMAGDWKPDAHGPLLRAGGQSKARASRFAPSRFAPRRPLSSSVLVSPARSRPRSREPPAEDDGGERRSQIELAVVDGGADADGTTDNDAWVDTDTEAESGVGAA